MDDARRERYRDLPSEVLKKVIQGVKTRIKQKYGHYQGVFSSTSPYEPTKGELDLLRQKIAAEQILEDRGDRR